MFSHGAKAGKILFVTPNCLITYTTGGMTIAAVETLESKGFRSAAMNAVMTSARSAIEAEKASSKDSK